MISLLSISSANACDDCPKINTIKFYSSPSDEDIFKEETDLTTTDIREKMQDFEGFLDTDTDERATFTNQRYRIFFDKHCNDLNIKHNSGRFTGKFTEIFNKIVYKHNTEKIDIPIPSAGMALSSFKKLTRLCNDKIDKHFDNTIRQINEIDKKPKPKEGTHLYSDWNKLKKSRDLCHDGFASNDGLKLKNFTVGSHEYFKKIMEIYINHCNIDTNLLEQYNKEIEKLKEEKEARCNTDINEPEGCIKELYKFLKPHKGEGDTLLYKCGHYPETKKSCCSNLDQEDCEHKKSFNTYLKNIKNPHPHQCKNKELLESNIYNKRIDICKANVKQCHNTCNTALEQFRDKFKRCFYVSSFKDAVNENSKCEKHIVNISIKYKEILTQIKDKFFDSSSTKKLYEPSTDEYLLITKGASIDHFPSCEKIILSEKNEERIKKESKSHAEQACLAKNSKDPNKPSSTGTLTGGSSGEGDSSSYNGLPSQSPSYSQVGPGYNVRSSTSESPGSSPSGNPYKPNGGDPYDLKKFLEERNKMAKDDETPDGLEDTDKKTKDLVPGINDDNKLTETDEESKNNLASSALQKSTSETPSETMSTWQTVKTRFFGSSSKSKTTSRGSYLQGGFGKRTLASNQKPVTLPQTYRSRDSGTKSSIGSANQNIFEMVSNSMNHFCVTKIKNCYTSF